MTGGFNSAWQWGVEQSMKAGCSTITTEQAWQQGYSAVTVEHERLCSTEYGNSGIYLSMKAGMFNFYHKVAFGVNAVHGVKVLSVNRFNDLHVLVSKSKCKFIGF